MSGPNVWGPHGWKFIHYITLGYPSRPTKDIKEKYYNFFDALQYVIPCSICGAHFREHMKKTPLTDEILSDKLKFIHWGIHMHNLVNEINGKKVYNLQEGVEDIKNHSLPYDCKIPHDFLVREDFLPEEKKSSININMVVLLCFIGVILFLAFKRSKN